MLGTVHARVGGSEMKDMVPVSRKLTVQCSPSTKVNRECRCNVA